MSVPSDENICAQEYDAENRVKGESRKESMARLAGANVVNAYVLEGAMSWFESEESYRKKWKTSIRIMAAVFSLGSQEPVGVYIIPAASSARNQNSCKTCSYRGLIYSDGRAQCCCVCRSKGSEESIIPTAKADSRVRYSTSLHRFAL